MPDSKFDLGDYVEVKDRIKLFYELFGQGRLVTERYELTREPDDKPKVIVEARAYRTADDNHPGVGLSWMYLPGSTSYTKGSELENTETSAWGRAIGSLGILIDRSIASGNEVRAKEGEGQRTSQPQSPSHEATTDGGLIGIAAVGEAPADYEIRMEEDGEALSFKLMDGRKGFRVVAKGKLAIALSMVKSGVIGQRVICWGRMGTASFPKGKATINYAVLELDRIQAPEFSLPKPTPAPQEAATEPPVVEDVAGGEDLESESPSAQPSPARPDAAGATSPEPTAKPSAPNICGNAGPYGDGATCGLTSPHGGLHRSLEADGKVVGSWPTT